ncbi:MAG: hypothetical protein WA919_15820 [Coleofasciculaceae cyanobacterium]
MTSRNLSTSPLTKKVGVYLGAITLGLTSLLLPACTQVSDNEEIQEGKTNITTEDVAEDTAKLSGKLVTVRSEVGEKVGNSGFILENEEGESILVINSTGATFGLPEGDMPIQATGEVAQLVIADVENKYGLDLEDELYVDYEDKPAIIARSLALAPSPGDIYEAPQGYFDKVIAIEGDVRNIYSPSSLTLFEDGWVDDIGVLVIGIDDNLKAEDSAVQEGERVTITGVARQFDPKLLQDSDLGWDEAKIKEFGSRYTNRPLIVAEEIYPSAVDNK